MANPTMTQIGSPIIVGAGGISSVSFSSIPNTYTDLKLIMSARSTATGGRFYPQISFNGATTNYLGMRLLGYDSGSTLGQGGLTDRQFGVATGASSTANTFSNLSLYIPNYNVTQAHVFGTESNAENNSSSVYTVAAYANSWTPGTAQAITSIAITLDVGNFDQYSTFYLYGIKNS